MPCIINASFSFSRETLYVCGVKPFAHLSSSRTLFQLFVAKRRSRSAFFRGSKFGSRKVPNRQCREDDREQFTPLLQPTPWSAKWCAVALSFRRKTRIIFLFGGALWIRWCYLFNLCTYRSDVTSCTSLQEPSRISTAVLSLVSLVAAVAGRPLRGLQPMARKYTQFHIKKI
jgi:hypothetical protein